MPITTDSRHAHAVAPNLLDRNFAIAVPDTVWLADISYIPTDEGWLYLAAVKDLATMEIVGWSMSDRLKSTLCEDVLKMAIRNRPAAEGPDPPLRQSMNTGQFPGGLALIAMDRLVGWRRKVSRCGLTRIPIDQPCLSPDLSAARDRLAVRFCLADACDPRRA